jgi:hypothetical protein
MKAHVQVVDVRGCKKMKKNEFEKMKDRMIMRSPPVTGGWGTIYPSYNQGKSRYTKAEFLNYCNDQLKSIKVAIDRKSKGSPAEDGYFMEHLDKLKNFFLESYVEK